MEQEATIIKLNSAEILYLFVGQITTSDKTLTAGKSHDCTPWVDTLSTFIEKHGLDEPRDGILENYTMPTQEADNEPTK